MLTERASLKTGFLKSASGESCPQQTAPDLRSELVAHSCELCSENIFKFTFPAAFLLQVFNLSLQMKCAVEKKMLITQLLHSAPTTEKFITSCPGLDRAVSIKMLTSLKQQLIASAMQQSTASNPQRPRQELVRVWYNRDALWSLPFGEVSGKKKSHVVLKTSATWLEVSPQQLPGV